MKFMWRLRTAGVFLLMTLILVAIGYLIGWIFGYGLLGITVMTGVSVLISLYSYFFSKESALRANRVRLITESEEPRLYHIVQKVAKEAGLPMPEVGISPEPMPNAFATGRNPEHAAVVATQGILSLLNDDELEAVFGHEMSHVKNRDILVMSVASTVASVLTFAARMLFYSAAFGNSRDRENNGLVAVVALLTAVFVPIAALLMQLAVSRNREFLADETGARITGKPRELASALRRLEAGCQSPGNRYAEATYADMWISNPIRKRSLFASLFSTHPSTEKRCERLEKLAVELREGRVSAYRPDEDSSKSRLFFQ
ncbi:MAG: zinc metalloprotease HtpX [Candidatus Methanomethylophilus sp.]|nr:zinc metalloprotease HtpX [Methanomethylophilus sp.]MDD3233015.1 zinc metalloprotease HtpX [Methanomethylophilus sp.]MDD4222245.1 zinc metalloprotease HtpX [Methanomethylophilus sp.]MDD4669084.1 zinc metalloprotease HtpX [Methanomethylophilus sp.]